MQGPSQDQLQLHQGESNGDRGYSKGQGLSGSLPCGGDAGKLRLRRPARQNEKSEQEFTCTEAHIQARVASIGNEFPVAVGIQQASMGIYGGDSSPENLRIVPSIQ